ncbi:MAG TPA: acetylglutamate kinase [Candidatus Marinimicrobia bacterium]|nr:acetylglutamate kinase [Candidatus Neomarinimicrobiota bacterium]
MREYINKADVLIEALPYIKAFQGKKIVIKFGGSIMTDDNLMNEVLMDIVFMKFVGWHPVIVHGGGPAITEAMRQRGSRAEFVNGLRVTDRETMDIVEDILAHKINSQIVNLLNRMDGDAVGLYGKNDGLVRVDKMMPEVDGKKVDIGYVGSVRYINAPLLNRLLEQGKIPVIAPIGVGDDGQTFNVNGDVVAGDLASSIGARKLVYLTDTPGILRNPADEKSVISTLTRTEAEQLIAEGVIQGGMIPKVTSCLNALKFGVNKGHIVDGRIDHSLLLEIFTREGIGTEILRNGSENIR